MPNYKITEPLVASRLGRSRTRSHIIVLAETDPVPPGAVLTTDPERDWIVDPVDVATHPEGGA